ncbi:MAG: zf-TFIIB domain-containing protein [Myxococcales bacterium]|nr:zf-TFIIB domain-containing protein [Myxococcales bacterium]MBL0193294.1 zf-TFIIB domain-containing protein [Myxococcales bacterium]HQY63068.1 zf-TFIIB domain-containing protein [Polyangiaceae bacterium]
MYREAAAAPPDPGESFCYFCGRRGRADQPCVACRVEMPAIPCACGARCSPFETACPHCRGPLREPDLPPMDCPACAAAHRPAGPLVRFSTDDLTLHGCNTCRGVFVAARAWCSLLLSPHRAPELPAAGPSSGGTLASLNCPACRRELERGAFAGRSGVTVDLCDRHGLWLDADELRGILRFCAEGGRDLSAAEAAPLVLPPPIRMPNTFLQAGLTGGRPGGRAGGLAETLTFGLIAIALAVAVSAIQKCSRDRHSSPGRGVHDAPAPTGAVAGK